MTVHAFKTPQIARNPRRSRCGLENLVPFAAVAHEEGHVLHDGHGGDLHLVEHALAAGGIIFAGSSTFDLVGFL